MLDEVEHAEDADDAQDEDSLQHGAVVPQAAVGVLVEQVERYLTETKKISLKKPRLFATFALWLISSDCVDVIINWKIISVLPPLAGRITVVPILVAACADQIVYDTLTQGKVVEYSFAGKASSFSHDKLINIMCELMIMLYDTTNERGRHVLARRAAAAPGCR